MTATNLFIFAGEPSGDLHGSRLMSALKEEIPALSIAGVGGPLMRASGMNCYLQMEEFQVMGFTDVLKSLPKLIKQFYFVKKQILHSNPSCVVLIDYPGFNLRLARALRRDGYKGKIVQYICPSVWAHGKSRIDLMANSLDLLLSIFPFEIKCFAKTSLRVEYVGNPLVDAIHEYVYDSEWKAKVGIPNDKEILAVFPGSRADEIRRNLPKQLAAALKCSQGSLAISISKEAMRSFFQDTIKQHVPANRLDAIYLVPSQFTYELMRDSRTAIAKSGTVTLELALHHTPTIVTYELSFLNYLIAKHVLRLQLPYFCLANLLMEEEVFPECIGRKISEEIITEKLDSIDQNELTRQRIASQCKEIQNLLGGSGSSKKAAQSIASLISC